MSLPKELLDAVKQDKKMLAKKFAELKNKLTEALKSSDKNAKANTNQIVNAVKDSDSEDQSTAFDSIIAQGKLAEEDIKLKEQAIALEKNLAASRRSLSEDEIAATEEQIALLKSGKLKTLEAKKEARENSERSNEALEQIAENQFSLKKVLVKGFNELRGEGLGGLIRMILVGIPSLLAGLVAGVGAAIISFLSEFKVVRVIFFEIGKFFAPLLKGFAKAGPGISKAINGMGFLGNMIRGLGGYAQAMFNMGKALAASLGKLVIPLTIILGIIGAIKGGIKGFKEDGIIGMLREGIIGVFDILIGGLVKMIGSMIGGIFKLLGFEKIGEGIKNGFSDFVDGIVGIFRGAFNFIAGALTLNFDRVKEGYGQLLDGILNTVIGAIKGIGGIIVGLVGAIIKGLIKLVILTAKLAVMALKGLLITLPIALLKFIGKALYFGLVELPLIGFELIVMGLKKLFVDLPKKLLDLAGKAFKFMIVDLPIMALNALVKGFKFMYITLPLMLLKVAFKILKGIFFDLPLLVFKLIFKAAKFFMFDLPIKLIKIVFPLLKGIFFDLPLATFKFIFTALKAVFFDLPIKLVGFAFKILKGIFIDLPLAAFKMVFDGIKFLFIGLPSMLIDKVKSFFTSMVESIGDAFSSAFDFVKRIGAASKAALKAAFPGGESPKEAFLRVMGGESGGEEKEEKENKEKIEESIATKDVKAEEPMVKPIMPKLFETADDFQARMMATVTGDIAPQSVAAAPQSVAAQTPALGTISSTETGVQSFSSEGLSSDDDSIGTELEKPEEDNSLFGKIKGIGNMMKNIIGSPFKLLGKVKDSVLGMAGDGVNKIKGIAGGAAKGLKGIGEAGLGALKTFAGFTPPGLLAKGIGKLFGKKKKKEDGVLEGPEGMTPVLSSKTPEMSETDYALKNAKLNQFLGNNSAGIAFDNQQVLRRFNNKDEQYVNPVDQIRGEGIIRDNQYEMVRRNSEGRLLDPEFDGEAANQFISPEDLEYINSIKNNGTFEFQQDDRIKQILDDGVKKKLNISNEDFTFDKRKEIVKGQLRKEEDDNRADARDARMTIQQIEDGTYNPKALTPAASIADGPKDAKVPQKLSFIDIIKKGATFAKKAASFTPPGMLIKGASKLGDLAKSEGGGFFERIREEKEQKRIATREKFMKIFGGGDNRAGSELTMGQKENAELKGENQGGGGAVIAPSSSVNNSKSSVTNTTISAPPHIDRTQNLFGNTVLDW